MASTAGWTMLSFSAWPLAPESIRLIGIGALVFLVDLGKIVLVFATSYAKNSCKKKFPVNVNQAKGEYQPNFYDTTAKLSRSRKMMNRIAFQMKNISATPPSY